MDRFHWMLPALIVCLSSAPGHPGNQRAMIQVANAAASGSSWEQRERSEEPVDGTWHDTGLQPRSLRMLAIDPNNPDVVYAAANSLHRSEDGGNSWSTIDWIGDENRAYEEAMAEWYGDLYTGIPYRSVGAIMVTAETPAALYVSASGTRMLLRSTNRGNQWENVIAPQFNDVERYPERYAIRKMAVEASDPRILYIAYGTGHGLHRSSDCGATWSEYGCRRTGRGTTDDPFYRCEYSVLAPDPHNPGTLYVAGWDPSAFYQSDLVSGYYPDAGVLRRTPSDSALVPVLAAGGVTALVVDPHQPGEIGRAHV